MNKAVIGSIDYIQIAQHGDVLVPAKIDTGADHSAVWATQIHQEADTLSFVFFGPSSSLYTGETHTIKRFKVASVKNSFGHIETRYKVLLKVIIGDQERSSWFSLADRSRNSYPVLLGKSFLNGRFLVDVAQQHVHSEGSSDRKVLIIPGGPKMRAFLDEAGTYVDDDVQFYTTRFKYLLFDINGVQTDIIDTANNNISLTDYDLVYVKNHWKHSEPAAALARFLQYRSMKFIDSEIGQSTSRSKLSELMQLATHAIAVPRSFGGYVPILLKEQERIIHAVGFPLVLKSATADRGKDNYIISDETTYQAVLEKVDPLEVFIVEPYIKNDGFYRMNVFGAEVRMAIFRAAHDHNNPLKQHLNKPQGGANARLVDLKTLPVEALELASQAAKCIGRQIAGVDILQDKESGEWYVLEANNSPQLRGGSYVDEKMKYFAEYIERKLEK